MDKFQLWLESAGIQWEDADGNPIASPEEAHDCTATLADGSKVTFTYGYEHVRVKYDRKSNRHEVEEAVKTFADANPDATLDGMDLDAFLTNYKEIKPNVYQRFEPEPGDRLGNGDTHEPDQEPNLADYMMRKSISSYPHGNSTRITPATGYVLPDGRTVTMGRGNNRDDDHRHMVPSEKAMEKWGWTKADSETQKMYELMRRSGAARIINSDPFVISITKPLTRQQRQVIRNYIESNRIKDVIVSFVGGKEYEFSTKDHRQMDRYL